MTEAGRRELTMTRLDREWQRSEGPAGTAAVCPKRWAAGQPARRRPHLVVRAGVLLALGFALAPLAARADPSAPAVEQRRQPPATASAESEYNRGIRARTGKDWKAAEAAFRRAIALRAAFPDAWNELGYALRNQGRYPESLQAYDEALRLRPDFPEALEYLGEAYVKLGRIEDARRILDRLRPLDGGRARELAEVIQKGK